MQPASRFCGFFNCCHPFAEGNFFFFLRNAIQEDEKKA